ncbi:Fpg/Nei family DNA glycosylase [Planctomycetaceae bacterium SH139]
MPEGHKTHYLANQQTEIFAGNSVRVSSPQGRFAEDAARVDGLRLERVEAVGKQLFYHFPNDIFLQVHLGRYGSFKIHPAPPPEPVGAVRMRMLGNSRAIDLRGPTTCRVIDGAMRQGVLAKIGPDPLAGGKANDVWEAVSTCKRPIGAILLDQQIIAGVGNIFRAELLFELRMNPLTPGESLDRKQFDSLWKSLVKMMRTGLKYGKIITVTRQEAGKPLSKLTNPERFRIYGKEFCPQCDGAIEKLKVASRDLYVCRKCQGIC